MLKNPPEDEINQFIRERLCEIRKEKRLSVRQAAVLNGIPESSYSCLEHGHYRITLQNLQKMLEALGIAIDEVWPALNQPRPEAWSSVPDANTLNYFRFREFLRMADAEQAALFLRRKGAMKPVYSFNLDQSETQTLQDSVLTGLPQGWKTYRKSSHEVEIYLSIKHAFVGDDLKRLLSLYMDLWLATLLT